MAQKDRMRAFNFCNPFDYVLPLADGTVDKDDRAQLWGNLFPVVVVPPTGVGEILHPFIVEGQE